MPLARAAGKIRPPAAGANIQVLSDDVASDDVASDDAVMAIFDTAFYLATNPDVAQSIAAGHDVSAYQHFLAHGRAEAAAAWADQSRG